MRRGVLTRGVLAGTTIALLVWFVWTADGWLIRPAQAEPTTATDAIFVNAGGQGERLDRALELVDTGVTEHLVLSPNFNNDVRPAESEWGGQDAIVALCDQGHPDVDVVCLPLEEHSTRGEARAFATYAERMGWDTVTLVTSREHLHRATLWMSRCFSGEVLPVATQDWPDPRFFVHEYLGNIEASLLLRDC